MPELKCEKVDDYYLLRDGASGIFLAASQFPKNRETRAPKLLEIKSHANELDPKFRYLLDGPEKDPDGNPSILRYSRKNKEQYLQTEIDGKATGWQAFFETGKWVESVKAKNKKKKAS
jgi:DNA topoisomerase-1